MGDYLEDGVFELEEKINCPTGGVDSDDDIEDVVSVDESEEDSDDDTERKKQAKIVKKRKKFEEMKSKKKLKMEHLTASSNAPIAVMDTGEQASLFNSLLPENMTCSYGEDIFFTIDESVGGKSQHMRAIISGMPSFRSSIGGSMEAGAPFAVIVCSSARRAAAVINSISPEAKCKVGKLFAKHFKVQDQVVALRQNFPIVVGTPNRLSKLIEIGALSLSQTRVVLVDMAEDAKGYHVLNLPGVSVDMYTFMLGPVKGEISHVKLSLVSDGNMA